MKAPHTSKESVMSNEIKESYHRGPWNKGKLTGQKPPLKLTEI